MTTYKTSLPVSSRHCDATGIVYFSRYTEMMQEVIEHWFDEALDWPYAQLHGRENLAIPVVSCETEFPAVSRPGDVLVWRINVTAIGRSSLDLEMTALCGGDLRARMRPRIILTETGVFRAKGWPSELRARLNEYLQSETATAAS